METSSRRIDTQYSYPIIGSKHPNNGSIGSGNTRSATNCTEPTGSAAISAARATHATARSATTKSTTAASTTGCIKYNKMASTTVVNQIASPAFRGQAAIVTLNPGDTLTKLPTLKIGDECIISSSSNIGYIAEIDSFGTTFKVTPAQPSGRFDSTSKGILAQGETITITI